MVDIRQVVVLMTIMHQSGQSSSSNKKCITNDIVNYSTGFFQLASKETASIKDYFLSVFALENYSSLYIASFEKFLNLINICVISSLITCACWKFLDALTRLTAFYSIESVVRQMKTNTPTG